MADTKLAPIASIAPTWTREQIELIKRTCVPAGDVPTDEAFKVFLHICANARLDPLLKEAYLIKRSAKDARGNWIDSWQTLVGRDGYLAAAQRTGEFRGIQTRVYPEDVTESPTHATCEVWREGWPQPVNVTVVFGEYVQLTREGRPTRFWAEKPRTMIGKVAQAQALRLAFSLHGTYSPEELPEEEVRPVVVSLPAPTAAALPAPEVTPVAETVKSATAKAVFARLGALGWSKDEQGEFCHRVTGKSRTQCTPADWTKIHLELDAEARKAALPALGAASVMAPADPAAEQPSLALDREPGEDG